jgi:methionyl-tRNA formyltransferase
MKLGMTAVKEEALSQSVPVYQPSDINCPESIDFLKKLQAEVFVVIAYGQILSEELLAIPRLLPINAHASLLPKYRGAAPINWALIQGEKETGVSIIKIIKQMDAGPLILKRQVSITPQETSMSLGNKLAVLAAELIVDALRLIEKNEHVLVPQPEIGVTFAPRLRKEDGEIDWGKSAESICRFINGCLGWPGAFSICKNKRIKIFKATVVNREDEPSTAPSGQIIKITKQGISVVTGEGNIIIEELQVEGKRRMTADEFIRGRAFCVGERFSKK